MIISIIAVLLALFYLVYHKDVFGVMVRQDNIFKSLIVFIGFLMFFPVVWGICFLLILASPLILAIVIVGEFMNAIDL